MEKQKRMAVINDFSGFGRCSLSVSIPIISAMKVQCCSVLTSIFSNHTGYGTYFFDDYTEKMKSYYSEWKKLKLEFDGIYTGFLGSEKQVETVLDFLMQFTNENTKVIIDPVMGDNGITYSTINKNLCENIRELIPKADIITPNITEACILADKPYIDGIHQPEEFIDIAEILLKLGCGNVVITGIDSGSHICNLICSSSGKNSIVSIRKKSGARAGTGDVFASVIAGDAVNGIPLDISVKKAAEFVAKAIDISDKRNVPEQDGICFEDVLSELIIQGNNC